MTTESKMDAELIATFLRERDVSCPQCMYNLRDCASDRCPECGAPIHLQVSGATSGTGWWLAGVFGAAATAAMSLVLVLLMLQFLAEVLQSPPIVRPAPGAPAIAIGRLPNWGAILLAVFFCVGASSLLAFLLAARRSFIHWPQPRRVLVSLAGVCSPLALIGLIALRMALV